MKLLNKAKELLGKVFNPVKNLTNRALNTLVGRALSYSTKLLGRTLLLALKLTFRLIRGVTRFTVISFLILPIIMLCSFCAVYFFSNIKMQVYNKIHKEKPQYERYYTKEQLPPLEMQDALETMKDQAMGLSSGHEAIVKMYQKDEDGDIDFHCSATVISNKYAITAGHCVVKYNSNSGYNELNPKPYIIKNHLDEETGTTAVAVGAFYGRGDVGLLFGDFRGFKKMLVGVRPGGMAQHSGPFLNCGFPSGGSLACYQFIPIGPYYGLIKGKGYVYAGMSGGPVVDASISSVVGVNSEMGNEYAAVSPFPGFFDDLKIKIVVKEGK